ncbi:MAG: citrate transporter [Chlorobiaceae bacterium]|nr:citrate transporter [Chlorobiaceae bacterium]
MSIMAAAPAPVLAAAVVPIRHVPPAWLSIPFVALLLMIATGPLLYPGFWEHHYRKVSVLLGAVVAAWYAVAVDGGLQMLWHTLEEYLSFIALVASLFVVAGGILVRIDREGSPAVNLMLLLFGALISNIVGTTGASMLLIRPYLRINEGRLQPFHVVFFIFIVGNIGGALTPIGDPPLFLGFLRGVPFFWVLDHLWLPWVLAVAALCLIFLLLDLRAGKGRGSSSRSGRLELKGKRNFLYLIALIASIFLDPAVIHGFPSLQELLHLPFGIRELLMALIAAVAYRTSNREALQANEFNFEPVREVAFLFIGIFATMIPALQLIAAWAAAHAAGFTVTKFYWSTGLLSGLLDNAPTYLNFLSAAMGKFGLDAGDASQVGMFVRGIPSPVSGDAPSTVYLMAVSMASVFFGALTYIGNAPNFMVRNIAAQTGTRIPDFVGYILRYSLPVLLPLFAVLWLLFFNC